jgi:microcystin-dependent protein
MSALPYTYNVAPNPSETAGGLPVGTIVQFGSSNAPTGWLLCDGSSVSKTTYAALFNVIGTTYGSGSNATLFLLPNTTGRTIRGGGTTGQVGGSDTVTLTVSNIAPHSHGMSQNGLSYNGGGAISSVQPNTINNAVYTGGDILSPGTNTVVTANGSNPTPVTVTNPFVYIPSIIKYA